MASPDEPHLSFPFGRDLSGTVMTLQQGSEAEITSCALLIANTPVGYRADRPEFGWAMPEMAMAPVDVTPLVTALNQFEPRAQATIASAQTLADAAMGQANLTVDLEIPVSAEPVGVALPLVFLEEGPFDGGAAVADFGGVLDGGDAEGGFSNTIDGGDS